MDESPTGNAWVINFQFPLIVRMTNTCIGPSSASFEDLTYDIKDGLYVCDWYGGMTSMEQFTFSGGHTFAIRNGKVEEVMRLVMLSGSLFTTLEHLDAVGNDVDITRAEVAAKAPDCLSPSPTAVPMYESRNASSAGLRSDQFTI